MKNLVVKIFSICFILSVKAQWIDQNAGFVNKTLGFYEFSIVDQNVVWAICYDGVGGLFGSNPTLDFTRTINGGTTWIPGTMGTDMTLAFSNISAISSTEAWVCMHKMSGTGGGLFHTTNSGLTWTQSNVGVIFNNSSFPNFVYFKDALNGIAGGNANDGYFEIYKTNNGGLNWTRTPQANFPSLPSGGGTGWFDGYAVIGDTVWFGTTASKMYKSTDFGTTWTISNVSSIASDRVYEIAFSDNGLNGLCHTRTTAGVTKLFATTNGGMTWVQRVTSTIPGWRRDRITAVPGTNKFVSTSTSNTVGSSFSSDVGLTWIVLESDSPKAACRFLNSSTGWTGGFFNDTPAFSLLDGIFKWDNSVNLATNSSIFDEKKINIFPNPIKDKLTIQFPEKIENNFKIEIIDILGRISFSKLFQNQVSNEIQLDVSNFAKGNYYLKISSENEFITKKIILF